MEHARPFSLNGMGEPEMQEGENRLLMKSNIDLYDGDVKPEGLKDGTIIVTTHRLLWYCPARSQRHAWDVTSITGVAAESPGVLSFLTKASPKLVLTFAAGGRRLKLSFKCDGQQDTLGKLAQARECAVARERERVAEAERARAVQEGIEKRRREEDWGPQQLGTSALAARVARKAEESKMESVFSASFSGGLDKLVAGFEELQGMVDALVKSQGGAGGAGAGAGGGGAGGGGGSAAPDAAEDALIGGLLRNMGDVRNPVTRQMASGRDFAPALAREVAGFILPRLRACGGLMSLTDVYCLYSRARGLDTISPDDLLEALRAMEGLRLGLAPRTLPGGLRVLQLDSLSDAAMVERALASLKECQALGQPYTTPNALANAGKMPAAVALQHLDTAVAQGALALDVSVAGKRYYPNLFSA